MCESVSVCECERVCECVCGVCVCVSQGMGPWGVGAAAGRSQMAVRVWWPREGTDFGHRDQGLHPARCWMKELRGCTVSLPTRRPCPGTGHGSRGAGAPAPRPGRESAL